MQKKKSKKRKKRRYKTGEHNSPKLTNGPAKYRSSWEVKYMVWLDENPLVVSYEYEGIRISYVSNYKTGKTRLYSPDFLVTWNDGKRVLVEIKPSKKIDLKTVQKKAAAAQTWCLEHDAIYEFVSEGTLKELGCKL